MNNFKLEIDENIINDSKALIDLLDFFQQFNSLLECNNDYYIALIIVNKIVDERNNAINVEDIKVTKKEIVLVLQKVVIDLTNKQFNKVLLK